MFRRQRPLGLIAGLGMAGMLLNIKPSRNYGPCIGCGNPAKGSKCFKCKQKAAAAGTTLEAYVASLQTANQTGEAQPASQEASAAIEDAERDAGSPAEPACVPETVA